MTESLENKLPYAEIHVDEQIELRQLRSDEAGKIFALVDDNREYLAEWLDWVLDTKTPEDSQAFISDITDKRAKGLQYGYGVFVDGELSGHISIMHVSESDPKRPEIGYWIASNVSGKSITAKGAQAVTDLGLQDLGLDSIIIRAAEQNIGSNKVAEKLGYTLIGKEQDLQFGKTNVWEKRSSSSST